jgi:FkbH-like protein
VVCQSAPYGQVTQSLLGADDALWSPGLAFTVVWTQPEAVLPGFARALAGHEVAVADIYQDVDDFCQQLLSARERTRFLFVPTWTLPAAHLGHGLLDLTPGFGVARHLLEANLRLLAQLDGHANVFALNASRWVEAAGDKAFNAKLWYLGKVPFGNDVFKAAARDLKAAMRGVLGRARKLLVLDLDHTLWDGVVGDDGWRHLVLGGHHADGEALVDFQAAIKSLTRRGVILAIASKNEEAVALEAIRSHPGMVLKLDDFAAWRINWQDKAQNVVDIAQELNIGLDATVFIDDNPAERARVRDAVPAVLVPEWPVDKKLYPQALRALDCFDLPRISQEDQQRQRMYATERTRNEAKAQLGSVDDWLQGLGLVVKADRLGAHNLARCTQLLNKTNQMNLSTRRLSEDELRLWADTEQRVVFTFSVSDRFGDAGLTGVLGLCLSESCVQVLDFVLSCRVMGRKVEESMLHVAVDWARAAHAKEFKLVYLPTEKNVPCLQFLQRAGLRSQASDVFHWDLARPYPLPAPVQLLHAAG